MEITTKRCLLLAGLLAVFGTAARLQPVRTSVWRTEEWMEKSLPIEAPGFSMVRSKEKPNQSYDAGKGQYDALLPYGIVCRIFEKGELAIDTVVIAGNDRDTFHDPYFCLPGQNWQISNSHQGLIPTKSRGNVPASIIDLTSPDGRKYQAVFCYKGPKGLHATQNGLYLEWFLNEIKLEKPPEGAFYRFMRLRGEMSEKELLEFAGRYLDDANRLSGGIL